MFVEGNGSAATSLSWYSAAAATELPQVSFLSVSIWWYRLAMLLWALWLALALLGWLQLGWRNLLRGGFFRHASPTPPHCANQK